MDKTEELREQLRWAWNQLGCRCIFGDQTNVKVIEDSHCPLHGDAVNKATYDPQWTVYQQLQLARDEIRMRARMAR